MLVVGCWLFLAVGDQFEPFQTLRFAVTFQTVHMPPLTSPCNPNFGPPKVPHFFSMRTTQPRLNPKKFRRFPIFGRFRTERTSRSVGNLAVSVSNAAFSPRNSSSSQFFGRKCFFDPASGKNSTFNFNFRREIIKEIINCFSAGLPGRREIINNSGRGGSPPSRIPPGPAGLPAGGKSLTTQALRRDNAYYCLRNNSSSSNNNNRVGWWV